MEKEEASKGLGPDEETFNVPVPLSQKVHKILSQRNCVQGTSKIFSFLSDLFLGR